MSQHKVHRYASPDAVVSWDAARCIHAAECVRTLPEVFDPKAKPWIRADLAELRALGTAVERCPSGALALHASDGGTLMQKPATNIGLLTPQGPLYVRGNITLVHGGGSTAETRVALCRCGASLNKPYCDNSHRETGFSDPGALPASVAAAPGADMAAPLTITPIPNGPNQVNGPLTLHGSGGRTAFAATTFLCRCGASRNKPYCDGSHRAIGFAG